MTQFDVSVIVRSWPYLLRGLRFTIEITAVGFGGGVVFGSLLAVAQLSGNAIVSFAAMSYVTLMRSVPLILVIFWVFFLMPWGLGWAFGSNHPIPVGATATIFVTYTLFEAAYYAEIVRSGLRSVSRGQYAASQVLGLSTFQTYRYVIFPQAIRNVLPILLTQTIILFQDTSLVYVISATDLFGAAAKIAQRDGRLTEMYMTVAAIYFAACFAASQAVKGLQTRLSYGTRR